MRRRPVAVGPDDRPVKVSSEEQLDDWLIPKPQGQEAQMYNSPKRRKPFSASSLLWVIKDDYFFFLIPLAKAKYVRSDVAT